MSFEYLNDSELSRVEGASIIPTWIINVVGWLQARQDKISDEYGSVVSGS